MRAVTVLVMLGVVLGACGSDGSESPAETTPVSEAVSATTVAATPTTAAVIYNNCDEVKAAGAAPIHSGDPGFSTDLDRDGDGVACEN